MLRVIGKDGDFAEYMLTKTILEADGPFNVARLILQATRELSKQMKRDQTGVSGRTPSNETVKVGVCLIT